MDVKLIGFNLLLGVISGIAANWCYDKIIKIKNNVSPQSDYHGSKLWPIVVVVYIVFIAYLIEEIWLVPIKYWFLFVISGFFFMFILIYLLSRLRRKTWQEFIVISVFPAIFLWAINPLFPKGISLTCPKFVQDDVILHGYVKNEHWKINILVNPFKTPEWWVQQIPVSGAWRRWQTKATFAGSANDRFQIIAIAGLKENLFKEGDTVLPGNIPKSVFRSKICEVIKL